MSESFLKEEGMERREKEGEGKRGRREARKGGEGGRKERERKTGKEVGGQQIIKLALIRCSSFLVC